MPHLKSIFFFLFTSFVVFAQEEVPFSIRFQQYVRGDLSFIANNIINRNASNNANEPYNKITNSAQLNDDFEMGYIDIDNDPDTFSSSSAVFKPEGHSKEIAFAGLYWAANYKFDIGTKELNDAFLDSDRSQTFTEIKIKTPDNASYQKIKGTLLFDGFTSAKYKNSSPYVCFSDITDLVQKSPFGEYTVANIKATQGFIEGGVSGGWIIYFVYKNLQLPPKYISIYDGFAHVFDQPIEIKLTNFLTPKTGQINPKITLCALEGDLNIEGDNVRLKNSENGRYFQLSSANRNGQNFFKSFITMEDAHFLDRNPVSLNTLGFDAVLQTLDNQKNQIIANNTEATEIKVSSTGDKVFLFTTGFSIEVDETFYENKKNNEKNPIDNAKITSETMTKSTEDNFEIQLDKSKKRITDIKIKVKELPETGETKEENTETEITPKKDTIATVKKDKISVFEESKNPVFSLKTDTGFPRDPVNMRKINVETKLKHGFYLIANVFSVPKNCTNYLQFLKRHHIKSDYFVNPENQYRYAYLAYYTSQEEALKAYHSNLNQTFFDEYWILEIDH